MFYQFSSFKKWSVNLISDKVYALCGGILYVMPHLNKQKQQLNFLGNCMLTLGDVVGVCSLTVKFEVGVGGMRVKREPCMCVYCMC